MDDSALESPPWNGAIPAEDKNDCNLDGDYVDATDDRDCNDNGVDDIVVKLVSEAEVAGEILALDRSAGNPSQWRGTLPVSLTFNASGVLFIQERGTDLPSVTVRYTDRNDGTNQLCRSTATGLLSPSALGIIDTSTAILAPTGRIALVNVSIDDPLPPNGDDDGYAGTKLLQLRRLSVYTMSNRRQRTQKFGRNSTRGGTSY